MAHSNTCSIVVELLQALMPSIVENYQKISPLGSTARAQLALEQLQTLAKSCDTTDTLMVIGTNNLFKGYRVVITLKLLPLILQLH